MQNLEKIKQQWAKEWPELDTSTMMLIGRLQLVHKQMTTRMNQTFRRFGLTDAGFDVIATLRRSGPPYKLTAGQLLEQMLVTSGSMTSRLGRLEKQGWVCRLTDEHDKRVVWVQLTPSALAMSDDIILAHVETQKQLLAHVHCDDRRQLTELLARYFDTPPEDGANTTPDLT